MRFPGEQRSSSPRDAHLELGKVRVREQRLLTSLLVSFTLHTAFLAFVPPLLSRPPSSLKRPLWVDLVDLKEPSPGLPPVAFDRGIFAGIEESAHQADRSIQTNRQARRPTAGGPGATRSATSPPALCARTDPDREQPARSSAGLRQPPACRTLPGWRPGDSSGTAL